MEGELWEGWLDRKGSALLQPWTRRFVVLCSETISQYDSEQRLQCKGSLILDGSTRIMYVDWPNSGVQNSDFRFCVATKKVGTTCSFFQSKQYIQSNRPSY
jgi:hypothetical protein